MLTDAELTRYARQAILPELGEEGQEKLLASRALILGAGGLGSPVIALLAAAGIGQLTICDGDKIELSNLNRQFIHPDSALGENKAKQAAAFANRLNPAIRTIAVPQMMTRASIAGLLAGQDMVLDCTDQMASRQLIAQAARAAGIPHIFGGAVRMIGQLSVFMAGVPGHAEAACLGCLFPQQPGPDLAPNCAEVGILGPVVSVIGSLMAAEAVKLAAGLGGSMAGRLLLYDGAAVRFDEITYSRQSDCPLCGDSGQP